MLFDANTPDYISIIYKNSSYSLVSEKKFNVGDIVFENTSLYINPYAKIHVRIKDAIILLDNKIHTVSRGDKREFFYFDTFCNHSCDPNCKMVYITNTRYMMICVKKIECGDELTCDYMTFDSCEDNTVFNCSCNSFNCRKLIYG